MEVYGLLICRQCTGKCSEIGEDKLGYQLKITDLSSKKIHWGDYKNMPLN
jgi:hypothetical protein